MKRVIRRVMLGIIGAFVVRGLWIAFKHLHTLAYVLSCVVGVLLVCFVVYALGSFIDYVFLNDSQGLLKETL